jgi:heptosyltransferase II
MSTDHRRDHYRSILIIKPGAMGDLLQLTPVLRLLKKRFPESTLTILVGSSASQELFRYNPNVDATIVYDRWNEHRSLGGLLRLRQRLKAGCHDLVLNFQRSNLKGWLLASAAFPCRVLIYHKSRQPGIHAVNDHLKTLAPLGLFTEDLALEFFPSPESEVFADRFFREQGLTAKSVVALNPGASHPVNRWDTRQFAELADRLSEEAGINVMIVGGKEDIPLSETIVSSSRSQLINLAGKTSISELGSLLKRCELLVSGDTGPLHLATSVGTRVVALFGAADPERTGPVGQGHRVLQAITVPCVPCRSRTCRNSHYLECMEKITVDDVYQAVMEYVGNSR